MSTNEAGDIPLVFPRLSWQNVEAQLKAAGIPLDNLVKMATILPSRGDAAGATGAQRGKQYG
jgi:hypothetical protein